LSSDITSSIYQRMELKVWVNFLSLSWEHLEGSLPHKRVETNRKVAEHKSYPLQ